MTAGRGLLRAATRRLERAGIAPARREARLLLAHVLGVEATALLAAPDRDVDRRAARAFAALVGRRAGGEPLSRIRGEREFWSLPFRLSPATLDPRPDSETLVEAVLAAVPDRTRALRLLDLGTGTGCLLLALLSEYPRATGLGVDLSEEAARIAAWNAVRLGLVGRAAFVVADWAAPLAGRFDVIVCNPPYVAEDAIARLAPEVAGHDPRLALDGGADGCAAYRRLAPSLAERLAPAGIAVLELGQGQAEAVSLILGAAGLEVDAMRADLAGIPRCVLAKTRGNSQKRVA